MSRIVQFPSASRGAEPKPMQAAQPEQQSPRLTHALVFNRLCARLQTLDVEQLQIAAIVVEGIARGRMR